MSKESIKEIGSRLKMAEDAEREQLMKLLEKLIQSDQHCVRRSKSY